MVQRDSGVYPGLPAYRAGQSSFTWAASWLRLRSPRRPSLRVPSSPRHRHTRSLARHPSGFPGQNRSMAGGFWVLMSFHQPLPSSDSCPIIATFIPRSSAPKCFYLNSMHGCLTRVPAQSMARPMEWDSVGTLVDRRLLACGAEACSAGLLQPMPPGGWRSTEPASARPPCRGVLWVAAWVGRATVSTESLHRVEGQQ